MTVSGADAPLSGLRVVELAGIGPAPFACTMLADLGCEIVRIGRLVPGANALPDQMASIGVRNRTTLLVNLKHDDGQMIAREVINSADVVVEPFRPGVVERLGLGPDVFADSNPGLVYARVTGWGQNGSYASMAGHDINYIALSGALAAIGTKDRPTPPINLLGDYAGGSLFAIIEILAALIERSRTGFGQVVDVAMVDGVRKLMEPIRDLSDIGMWSEERESNLIDGGAPFYRTYRTSDDRFVAVGALEPGFYSHFVAGLGLIESDLPNRFDPANWDQLADLFGETFAFRTRDEWQEIFDSTDACVVPVLTMSEVESHPQNRARGGSVRDDGPPDGDSRQFLRSIGLSDDEITAAVSVGALSDDGA